MLGRLWTQYAAASFWRMIPRGRPSSCCLDRGLASNKKRAVERSKGLTHVSYTPWPLSSTSSKRAGSEAEESFLLSPHPGWPGWNVLSFCTPRTATGDLVGERNPKRAYVAAESCCEARALLCLSASISNRLPRLSARVSA